MKKSVNHAVTALLVFFASALALVWATGNLHTGGATTESVDHDHHESHDSHSVASGSYLHAEECGGCAVEEPHCDDEDHHRHAIDSRSGTDTIFDIKCEHDIGIIDCDECRYEAGVVKIGPQVSETLIETATVSRRGLSETLELTGRIELDQSRVFEVASAGKGRVVRIDRMLGQRVKAGDILAVVQSAELGRAKAEYLRTLARLELAQATFAREKDLYDKQITSQDDYLKARNELRSAEACLAADEKRLALFGMSAGEIAAISREKDNENFARLVLSAPADGTIIRQNITTGKLIDTTESLYTIADLSNLWAWCDLYEKDLARMHRLLAEGTPVKATLRVAAFKDVCFEGTVDLITGMMDTETRTVQIRLQVRNNEGMLKPGMFADVSIPVGRTAKALMVPKTALLTDEGQTFLFRHLRDDLWLRQNVVTGRETDGYVQIISGLTENARVVTRGAFMLKSDVLREKMGAGCAH